MKWINAGMESRERIEVVKYRDGEEKWG